MKPYKVSDHLWSKIYDDRDFFEGYMEELEKVVQGIEREACAKVAKNYMCNCRDQLCCNWGETIAGLIRERSNVAKNT